MSRMMTALAVLLVVVVLSVACGGDDTDADADPDPGQKDVAGALEASVGSEVTVSGFLIVDRDGAARLCSGLLESFPPQCGDDRIDLADLDVSSVPNISRTQGESEISTAMWTDAHITVTGVKAAGGLTSVRLGTGD